MNLNSKKRKSEKAVFCKTSWPCDHLSPRSPLAWSTLKNSLLIMWSSLDDYKNSSWQFLCPTRPPLAWSTLKASTSSTGISPQGDQLRYHLKQFRFNFFSANILIFFQELSGGPSVPYQDMWLWHWKPRLQVFNCVPCQMWLSTSGKYSLNSLTTKKVVA